MMVELRMQKGVKFTVPAYSRYGVEEKQKFFLKTAGLEKVDTTDYGEHICIRPWETKRATPLSSIRT